MEKAKRISSALIGNSVSHVESETSIRAKDSTFESGYKVDDTPALAVEYTSKVVKQFSGYILIKKDLKFCRKSARLAIQFAGENRNTDDNIYVREEHDVNEDMLQALMTSFTITYAKCFTQAHGRGIKLEAKQVFRDNPELLSIHDFIMDFRMNDIAHSGKDSSEKIRAYILLDPDENQGTPPKFVTHSNHAYGADAKLFEYYLQVVSFLEEYIINMVEKIYPRIEKEIASVGSRYLYELASQKKALKL
ncbi:TPA: hypothetical protein ACMDSL_004627 [Vibrio parahaemolyticus]|uniref:hypothetical protein n=1 Tax=Vibrio parahaemolyticus TaxID=670 RepID=UPI00084B582F|nr:hypothetical protein [Vibrio parahaemolyticus]EJG0417780.1 hypothetical protein [Vibrio parahaemolyticus]EJG0418580.1 hypothetical protein [Vibrio parahaemolyticus]OEA73218.1 hypothetical protein BBM67_13215 [Vibrio parahaemolyticus]OEA77073.1 hypothetical protein BBM68_06760 [Vibrio parahaemolyticus]